MEPTLLPPNSIEHQYLGGDLIAALRGGPGGPNRPEEWLGSATTRFGSDSGGLTTLPVHGLLRDLIEADPIGWLGPAHVERFGTTTALLVKLLHAGQRLPVHLHPSQSFAERHLGCPFGKSEAWLVLDKDRTYTTVYVGTNRPVERAHWEELMAAQDSEAMLELLNPIQVEVGDGIFVPAGSPHAIGQGLLIMELQEPTDFSILLEWEGFEFDGPNDGHLDLGFQTALGAINPSPFDQAQLDKLTLRATDTNSGTNGATHSVPLSRALPPAADPYFKLHRVSPAQTAAELPPTFAVMLVIDGDGMMSWGAPGRERDDDKCTPVTRGEAYVIPHGVGAVTLEGPVTALVATPPNASTPPPTEFDH